MSVTLASEVRYSAVCEAYETIAKARGNKKTQELHKFLEECRRRSEEIKIKHSNAVRVIGL